MENTMRQSTLAHRNLTSASGYSWLLWVVLYWRNCRLLATLCCKQTNIYVVFNYTCLLIAGLGGGFVSFYPGIECQYAQFNNRLQPH